MVCQRDLAGCRFDSDALDQRTLKEDWVTLKQLEAPPIDEQMKAVVKIVTEQVAHFLATLYPDVYKTNPARIADAAQAAAADVPRFQPLLNAIMSPESTHILRFELHRVGIINPKLEKLIEFDSPGRIENCLSGNEVLSTTTLLSLLMNDGVRALLYFHGYRLNWKLLLQPQKPSERSQ